MPLDLRLITCGMVDVLWLIKEPLASPILFSSLAEGYCVTGPTPLAGGGNLLFKPNFIMASLSKKTRVRVFCIPVEEQSDILYFSVDCV